MKEVFTSIKQIMTRLPNDKMYHFFFGALIAFILCHVPVLGPLGAFWATLVIAICVEIGDALVAEDTKKFSVVDIVFTVFPAIMLLGASNL